MTVHDVAPTAIVLTPAANPVLENKQDATIGTLAISDPGVNDTHTIELLSGWDDVCEIVGGNTLKLKAGVVLDYEQYVYGRVVIPIRVTDGAAEPRDHGELRADERQRGRAARTVTVDDL